MKKIFQIDLDNMNYKTIKNKNYTYLQLSNDEILKLKRNDSVIINNTDNKKSFKRKIKKIYNFKGLNKKQYVPNKESFSKEDIENNQVIAIEFKRKRKFIKILLTLILVLGITFLITTLIDNYKNKKFISNIEKISNEKIITVIVDINPSIALKVKNNTVIESQCLNQDCTDLLNKMNYTYNDNLNNQKLDKVITEIYEASNKYGYDTSNGITVSSTSDEVQILVNNIKELNYKHITVEEEKNLLSNVVFKEEEITKEQYNNLLMELKNDKDYDITYTCDIYDGEVKCYIKDFISKIVKELKHNESQTKFLELSNAADKMKDLLNKFNVHYDTEYLAIKSIRLSNGKSYNYSAEHIIGTNDGNNNITNYEFANALSYEIYRVDASNAILEEKTCIIPFDKVDLLTKTYLKKDVVCFDYTGDYTKVIYGIE